MSTGKNNQLAFSFVQAKGNRLDMLRRGEIPEEFQGECTAYLFHANKSIGNHGVKHGTCQHYGGIIKSTDWEAIQRRIKQHKRGNPNNSSKLTAAMKKAKCKLEVARLWIGCNAEFEKYLKSWKKYKDFCPVCLLENENDPLPGHHVPFYDGRVTP